jgi:hypothetical protein
MLHAMAHRKATIHIYSLKKFQKSFKNYNHGSLPKLAKSSFGLYCPLGVKSLSTSWNFCFLCAIP